MQKKMAFTSVIACYTDGCQSVYIRSLAYTYYLSVWARQWTVVGLVLIFPTWLFADALGHASRSVSISSVGHVSANLSFRQILPDELVSIGAVLSMVQDEKGYIWLGGQNGLARYDGVGVEIFLHDPNDPSSLSNNYVNDMVVDKQGNLWVATQDGVNRYDYNSKRFERLFDNIALAESSPPEIAEMRKWLSIALCLMVDKSGELWIGTYSAGLARYNSVTGNFIQYFHDPSDKTSLQDNIVRSLVQDDAGKIWVGLNGMRLSEFDLETETFTHYVLSEEDGPEQNGNQIVSLQLGEGNAIWIGSFGKGFGRFNIDEKAFQRIEVNTSGIDLLHSHVRDIYESRDGTLWITTDKQGLLRYEVIKKNIIQYLPNTEVTSSVSSRSVTSIMEDRAGDLWLGLSPSGVEVVHRHVPHFANYRHNPFNEKSIPNNEVLAIEESADGSIWVGTEKGLTRFRDNGLVVDHFRHDTDHPFDVNGLPAEAVLSLLEDSRGDLWVGTWGGGLSRYHIETKTFTHYAARNKMNGGLVGDRVWEVYEDGFDTIWVGTERAGLSRYLRESDSFVQYAHDPSNDKTVDSQMVRWIYEDSSHNFWVATYVGLDLMDRKTGEFIHFRHDKNDSTSVSSPWVKTVYEDTRGNLWVGTHGGGLNLFNKNQRNFTTLRKKDGLADNVVTGILEDDKGFLWISGHNGLSRMNPVTKEFKIFDKRHGLVGNLFRRSAHVKRKNGDLIFGSTEGFTIFNPLSVKSNLYAPPIVVDDFKLFNRSVLPGENDAPIDKAIGETPALTLNHKQSVFTFEFKALNYRFPERNHYAYMLQGFDKKWNYVETKRSATYTNLDPGRYVFHVKAANDEGLWNQEGVSIDLTILPPLWRTWWAYLCYVGAFFALVYFVFQYQLETRAYQRLMELDRLKDEFLAQTSHELRTPLNGIIGLAESMIDGAAGAVNDTLKENLRMVAYSGKRLSNLINDILDFSKLKDHALVLNKKPIDIYAITDVVLNVSQTLIQAKPVVLKNCVDKKLPFVIADENRIQQIMYNLVGNAIKFTNSGSVEVSAQIKLGQLHISVKDTGIGISKDNLEKVFKSFEQAETSYGGTGLGLSVTKQLVNLHGGEVFVQSELGRGATFTFTLPLPTLSEQSVDTGEEGLNSRQETDTQIISSDEQVPVQKAGVSKVAASTDDRDGHNPELVEDHHIVIVDDDPVNRMVLQNYLSSKYARVTEVSNGSDLLEMLAVGKEKDIDLILLDVMMIGLSGYQVCRKVREKYTSQQLPVIFLTGMGQAEDLEAGYRVGANDFLAKPVLKNDLLARVGTQLKLSKMYCHIL